MYKNFQYRIYPSKTTQSILNNQFELCRNLFKTANDLLKKYDTIFVEDLSIKNMMQNGNLAKHIADCSWSNFINILKFKAVEAGTKEVIKVNPKGTSQICSQCGAYVKKDLSIRVHNCPNCRISISRDLNASINILRLGISLPTSVHRVGEAVCFS